MRIRYLQRATRDIIAIAKYIRGHDSRASIAVELRIRASIARLGRFPESGHATDDSSMRVLTVPRYPYLVFYEAKANAIIIHYIRDSRRKPRGQGTMRKKV